MWKLIATVFLGIVLGVTYELQQIRISNRTLPQTDQQWRDFSYKIYDQVQKNDFDLVIPLTCKKSSLSTAPAFRILTNYLDKNNYVAITCKQDSINIIKNEAGLAIPLAQKNSSFSLKPGSKKKLRIKWRAPQLTLLADGIPLLSTRVGFEKGRVGIGSIESALQSGKPIIQPVAPIIFNDDFMRGVKDVSPWQPADNSWEVRSIDNPSRSSNAFIYQCKSDKGSISLLGKPYWDNYRIAVSVFGAANGEVGLVFNALDAKNYFLLRWSTEKNRKKEKKVTAVKAKNNANLSSLSLLRVQNGKEKILCQKTGGYKPEQWYRLEVISGQGQASCLVDKHLLLQQSNPSLSGGRVGLYAKSKKETEFDDFQVQTYLGTFAPQSFKGKSQTTSNIPYLYGRRQYNSYIFSAQIKFNSGKEAKLTALAAYQDPFNSLRFVLKTQAGKIRQSLQRLNGKPEQPEELTFSIFKDVASDKTKKMTLRLDKGILIAQFSGQKPLSAWVGMESKGYCGFLPSTGVAVSKIKLTPLSPLLKVATINEIFNDEALMVTWSGTTGDWRKTKTRSVKYDNIFWHRGLFYGETKIEAFLGKTNTVSRNLKQELALSVCKPLKTEKKTNGYTLRYLVNRENKKQLILVREGKEVKRKKLASDSQPYRLSLRACGPLLLACINEEAALVFYDKQPLTGKKVAWAEKGFNFSPGKVTVYNNNMRSYSFNRAPVDWRIGAGIWEVTNRWECDPRWSFWAGMNGELAQKRIKALGKFLKKESQWKIASLKEQLELLPDNKNKHSVLWYKNSLSGDLMVEVFIGQMMDNSRGNYKQYVRDFNLTICGNGKDLQSGYSCILGGWKNSKSAIMRNGKIVAQAPGNMLSKGSPHRRWIRLRVTRHGNNINFTAHTQNGRNQPEIRITNLWFKDPKPLTGKRLAIWSYDCGILVARARISAQNFAKPENPQKLWPLVTKSIY